LTLATVTAVRAATVGPDTVIVRNGTLRLRGLFWRPAGQGPFPAVLFNHGSGAQLEPDRASRIGPLFARHGYAILYLFRRGAGLSARQGTQSGALMDREMAAYGQEGRNRIQMTLLERDEMGDARAGLAWLRGLPEVNRRRVALVGHSFGGSLTLLMAERDPQLKAAVVFGAGGWSWERSPRLRARLLAAVDHAQAPLFLIHAANDYSIAPGESLAVEMERHGKPHRLEIYPAVGTTPEDGHDFVYSSIGIWESDVFAFLDEHVRGVVSTR
jgi:dienelactone hydrolase